MEAMLELPMESVLDRISLDQESKAVLLGKPSALRCVCRLMLVPESGEGGAAAALGAGRNLDTEQVAGHHWQAKPWAREISAAE